MFNIKTEKPIQDLTIPTVPQNILVFDANNQINVAKFNNIKQFIYHHAQGNRETKQEIDVVKIAAANIVYNLASRPNIQIFEVPRTIAIKNIIANISDDISNKEEVASQLYDNWLDMRNSQLFIQNVAAQRSRNRIETDSVDGSTPELQLSIIPNYSLFIKNLLAAYGNTIITSDDHNILKAKEFIYVTELLLSTAQGRNFDITKC
ncbi:hypothetical protein NOVO_07340 [Rickettsiales bacterium Ac37b]|nr:hypothetical protein NOVO_07340 [Rickettsiales bacterium Ac37b]